MNFWKNSSIDFFPISPQILDYNWEIILFLGEPYPVSKGSLMCIRKSPTPSQLLFCMWTEWTFDFWKLEWS